jgi:diaminopimelate epimerase
MPQLAFAKYHGTGNDFILVDNRSLEYRLTKEQIAAMCDRHFGIGSDGLIFIEPSSNADYLMNFHNPDGSVSFCGNGSRCAFAFARKIGICGNKATFEASDGIHYAAQSGEWCEISMRDVLEIEHHKDFDALNTGSPHYILYCDNAHQADIVAIGRKIRYSEEYKAAGINVNLVQKDGTSLKMATYERGVEDETLSCGTGVTAAALAASRKFSLPSPIKIFTKGGELSVRFEDNGHAFQSVFLAGPTQFVYEGVYAV